MFDPSTYFFPAKMRKILGKNVGAWRCGSGWGMINGHFDNKYATKETKQRTTRVCSWGINILNIILTISFIVQVSEKFFFVFPIRFLANCRLSLQAISLQFAQPSCYQTVIPSLFSAWMFMSIPERFPRECPSIQKLLANSLFMLSKPLALSYAVSPVDGTPRNLRNGLYCYLSTSWTFSIASRTKR